MKDLFGNEIKTKGFRIDNVHFSTGNDDWATPQDIFDELNKEWKFTLDPCASHNNHKCDKYYTKEQNGLLQDWSGERVFMNPPYSDISEWMKKAYHESNNNASIVCLIPSRTDTRWWHKYVMRADKVKFIKGRLKFGNAENSAPFPSVIVIFQER